MTEEDALTLYDFLYQRLLAWDIALSISPKLGRIDGRTKESKASASLLRDLITQGPQFFDCFEALQRDEDPADLWPLPYRDIVRFRLWHRSPQNAEPLSGRGIQWPEWVEKYGKKASIDDHPPFPIEERTP